MTAKEINTLAIKMANILADKVANKVLEKLGWNPSQFLPRKEAAEFIGYSESYLKKRTDIPTYKIGRKTLYRKEDLTAFLNNKNCMERKP